MLHAYKGYSAGGRAIPLGNQYIPDGREVIITVMDAPVKDKAARQREAFKRFLAAMDATPPLPAEFDAIIARRVNIKREVEL